MCADTIRQSFPQILKGARRFTLTSSRFVWLSAHHSWSRKCAHSAISSPSLKDSRNVLYGPFQDNPDWEGVNTNLFVAATLEIAHDHAAHILPDADGTVHIAWQFGTE